MISFMYRGGLLQGKEVQLSFKRRFVARKRNSALFNRRIVTRKRISSFI